MNSRPVRNRSRTRQSKFAIHARSIRRRCETSPRVAQRSLRSSFCIGVAIAFTLAMPYARAASPPNVVLVMTDDQGYGDLGCHGNPILKTPELDRLYSDSIRLTNFHVSPFCTPTRAALMTGNHPAYTGAYRTSSGRTMMHPDEKTIANMFADAGYVTGMFGKWHLGDNAPHRPQDRGFQHVLWHKAGGVGQAPDYWGNDYFDDTYERASPQDKQGTPVACEGYCTDVWFREAIQFIEEHKERPFFLYLPTNAPHGPYHVAKKWSAPYQGKPGVVNPNFYGMIANIDFNVGLLRERVEQLGLAENTIFVFMTDNGTSAGAKFQGLDSTPLKGYNAGMRGKKSSVYDGGHRVPFFIHWPNGGLTGGKDIDTLTAHIDVLPTLADLCKVEVSDQSPPDGVSLEPLLAQSNDSPPESWPRKHHVVQYHGGPYGNALPAGPYAFSVVMTDRWRLVNSGNEALYDIRVDAAQQHDVSDEHPEVVEKLRELYKPFWHRISPRMTPVRIDLGNPAENPTRLSSQDWRIKRGNPPWNFNSIKRLPKVTGPWMVNVKRAGHYRVTLRQWPAEANKPVIAERAKISIAGLEKESEVSPGSLGVTFDVDLPAGPTELVTYLYDRQGNAGGAYFTDVEWKDNHQ
ncbi:arylsulfatase [Rhodopirellula sallentina]|nr:arylsulfatase [Rhodopirellula sallentina]